MDAMEPTQKKNVINGFRKCGIVPFDKKAVAGRIHLTPTETQQESDTVNNAVFHAVLNILETIQQSLNTTTVKPRKKRITIVPGKSISLLDFQLVAPCSDDEDKELVLQNESEDTHSECSLPPLLKQRIAMAKKR
jgi:hypothetical protein